MDQPTPANQPTPGLFRNYISWAGAALAIFGLGSTIFLALIDFWTKRPNPYLGIFAYVVFPLFLILGLILIPLGMLWERRRRRAIAPSKILPYPRIDFNNARHRRIFGFFLGVSLLVIPLSAVGSYRAYELTESVGFCGVACHTVMKPEYTAYLTSPHARVACVECHVGPGAPSYIRAKFSGVRRLHATLFNSFHRPIPSPLDDLRPAQETCGQCHWPEKFFGTVFKTFTHYGTDENNTPRQIDMLLKVGGGSPTTGITSGIHWHMNISNEILYISTGENHQVIPWVRLKDMNGQVVEYLAKDAQLTPEQIASMPKRRMNCMDCHNRSAHTFNPPDRAVNESLLAGRLDVMLPFIKQQAVEVLTKEYAASDEAFNKIAEELNLFYQSKYPDVYANKQNEIKRSISEVQRIYQSNFFPEMKVNWQSYPENIGHYYSAGCFRCHDGQHLSNDGKVIRKDCAICHTVQSQLEGKARIMGGNGEGFKHPLEMGDMTEATCTDCHTGKGVGQ
jgi:nitrate/TMAO reductase-like tetraheme cytochrome c subunit